eukprot:TRINITY_DN26035_c0_g1_i1.p1 TRINITY_DN26035_c0_g1~~TRINITY_DN26035_c0_g1_i1.p1  ORF type:complete len:352 (-),score=78.02 TRINITY_DN26035_c0_g1_i1:141-1196(-)
MCIRDRYKWQRANNAADRPFVLHDGPPYANGSLHIGHALNKVLKDVINRYKVLQGYRVDFVPGWDCHGLPIELKAMKNVKNRSERSPTKIRRRAKQHALDAIEGQRQDFQRWGVMADWDDVYQTMSPEYEASVIQVFQHMVQNGLVQRKFRPVHWSPSSRTALAEAELEYNENHKSVAAWVGMPISDPSGLPASAQGASAVVWTTTPWTLPANTAVCFSVGMDYVVVQHAGERYLVSEESTARLAEALGLESVEVEDRFPGSALAGVVCEHPVLEGETSPMIAGEHVTDDMGSGFVHTAPAHGVDDFEVCQSVPGLEMRCVVDDLGRYTNEVGVEELEGCLLYTSPSPRDS